jgi:Ca2+-transporting ATPase
MVYMGSVVVYGRGKAVVTATGMQTEMGKIAGALAQAEEGLTPLQIKLTQLSRILTWLVLGICAVIFAVNILRFHGTGERYNSRFVPHCGQSRGRRHSRRACCGCYHRALHRA